MQIIKSEVVEETCAQTASIRFRERDDGRRILQQLWWVTTVSNPGIIVKQRGEWRDVECVGPDASNVE